MINLYKLSAKSSNNKSGFTIVEVTLVMAFLGILLIAIAMILINISSLYQKGLVVKSVNSVGRGLVSELTSTINAAPSIDSVSLCELSSDKTKCLREGAFEFIFQSRNGSSTDSDGVSHTVQYGGAFCTGNYTYIWNTYYGKKADELLELTYYDSSSNALATAKDFKVIKLVDRNYRTCSRILEQPTEFQAGKIDISHLPNGAKILTKTPEEGFLDSTDVDLQLYELTIFPVSQDVVTLRAFFSGTFILATDRGDVNIFRAGDYCNPNAISEDDGGGNGSIFDLGSEFNYCAVNKFNFAARSTGNTVKR